MKPQYCEHCGQPQMRHLSTGSGYQCEDCGYVRYLNSKPSAMGLIVKNSKVLLVTDDKLHWDFPGGFLDEGEEPLCGLMRECSEELGITVHSASLVDLVVDEYRDGSWSISAAYIVHAYAGEPSARAEINAVAWFPFRELPRLRYRSTELLVQRHLARPSARPSRASHQTSQ